MTMEAISEQELQRIQDRCSMACAEPLAIISQKRGRVVLCQNDDTENEVVVVAKYYGTDRLANASFAASANQDVRRLLAEVQRLRALLVQHGIPLDV